MSARDCDAGRALVAAGWSLPGDLRSIAAARAHVREALSAHVSPAVLADAVLAASELATNAVRYTASGAKPGGRYALAVAVLAGRVRVAVVDQGSADAPRVAPAAEMESERLGGRGLGCLACLGSVGWEDVPPGRRVWADLPVGGAR